MGSPHQTSVRFNPLTALLWLLVSGGIIFLLWNIITRISGQNMPVSTPTANQTQVYRTIAVMLTAQSTLPSTEAIQTKTLSPTASQTRAARTPLPTSKASTLPGIASVTITPATLCNRAKAGSPLDITIPDDSEFSPGDRFIKTWRLVNIGSCTWTTQYSASFFYGDQMQAPRWVALPASVPPEHAVEISIEMVAPESSGTYQGNWMLSSENGDLFGIGPNANSAFWVRISVVEEATDTPAPTLSVTPTITPTGVITPTETPVGDMSGTLQPMPGDTIDLDMLTLNGEGADLVYEADGDGDHQLAPQEVAKIGIFGNEQPSLPDCQAAELSSSPLEVESLTIGIYLCYITNDARLGQARLAAMDENTFMLTLELTTWALP